MDEVEALVEELVEEKLADERAEREALREQVDENSEQIEAQQEQLDELETTGQIHDTRLDSITGSLDRQQAQIAEIQSRELEKGAHLLWENVEPCHNDNALEVDGDLLEKIAKDDERQYARLPDHADPLGRGGETTLAHSDLLPIQQVARLDDDMLTSKNRPVELAAKAWQERNKHSPSTLWNKGCNGVKEYLDAGELATWIRVNEDGVSKDYAQKLAGRTIEALIQFSKNRLYDEMRTHRKDGLKYKERRLILPDDADVPGETTSGTPQTAGVCG
jgi:DNA repair exonuclease SbcCD ATPase subunit